MFRYWNGTFWALSVLTLCSLLKPIATAIPHLKCTIVGFNDLTFVAGSGAEYISGDKKSITKVQELKVTRADDKSLCSVDITIGVKGSDKNFRKLTTLNADGIVLATPYASTGASLRAGGAYVHHNVLGILFTPDCAHLIGSRPIILPRNTIIKISWQQAKEDKYNIFINGCLTTYVPTTADNDLMLTVEYDENDKLKDVAPVCGNIFEGFEPSSFDNCFNRTPDDVYVMWFQELAQNYYWNRWLN